MNRYALASLRYRPRALDSKLLVEYVSRYVLVTNRQRFVDPKCRLGWISSILNCHLFLDRDMKERDHSNASWLPRFLHRETRGAFPKSVSIDRYRAAQTHCECRRTRTHTPAYVRTCVGRCARARARTWIYSGRMEPPTHHHLYRLHTRWRGRWFVERAVLRERTTRQGEIAYPCLRSVSFAASFIALRWRPTIRVDFRGRERNQEAVRFADSFSKRQLWKRSKWILKDEGKTGGRQGEERKERGGRERERKRKRGKEEHASCHEYFRPRSIIVGSKEGQAGIQILTEGDLGLEDRIVVGRDLIVVSPV